MTEWKGESISNKVPTLRVKEYLKHEITGMLASTFNMIDALEDAHEAERADKWERVKFLKEKAAELQADRDQWKDRAEKAEDEIKIYDMFGGVDGISATLAWAKALERAIRVSESACHSCINKIGCGWDNDMHKECVKIEVCDIRVHTGWQFDQERFTVKEDDDANNT